MAGLDDGYAFLGNGWNFPVLPEKITGRIQECSCEENIRQSIYLIIMTRKGERVMRPDFGCDIHKFMFDTVDYTILTMMKLAVEEALIRWEPRITDIQVQIFDRIQEKHGVEIRVDYRVRTTNNLFNLVFPFYLEET
jgi:phage baseplate assembly protein W